MRFNDQKVLVIGGAGFVGSNLCDKLFHEGASCVTIVDNLLSAQIENLPQNDKLDFIFGSIADDRILMNIAKDYDYVFHLATYHGNQSSIYNPIADHKNNALTTLKICEHFKDAFCLKKIVYSSAGCTVAKKTYDDVGATDEEADVSLYHDSPYQISKIIGEFYGNYYWMKYQLPFVKTRFQNVYGPREILGAGAWRGTPATVWRNVIPIFIWKSLHQEELPLENEGKASRDFIYVDDVIEGLIICAVNGKPGEVYNLASGAETRIAKLAETINRLTVNPTSISYTNPRPWDRSGKRFGSIEKAKRELGFSVKTPLEHGLKKTIAWTRENHKLISANMSKHLHFMPELSRYL